MTEAEEDILIRFTIGGLVLVIIGLSILAWVME